MLVVLILIRSRLNLSFGDWIFIAVIYPAMLFAMVYVLLGERCSPAFHLRNLWG